MPGPRDMHRQGSSRRRTRPPNPVPPSAPPLPLGTTPGARPPGAPTFKQHQTRFRRRPPDRLRPAAIPPPWLPPHQHDGTTVPATQRSAWEWAWACAPAPNRRTNTSHFSTSTSSTSNNTTTTTSNSSKPPERCAATPTLGFRRRHRVRRLETTRYPAARCRPARSVATHKAAVASRRRRQGRHPATRVCPASPARRFRRADQSRRQCSCGCRASRRRQDWRWSRVRWVLLQDDILKSRARPAGLLR